MAKRTVEFVLSEETAENLGDALQQLEQLKNKGFSVSDVRMEDREQDGARIKVGVIEASK